MTAIAFVSKPWALAGDNMRDTLIGYLTDYNLSGNGSVTVNRINNANADCSAATERDYTTISWVITEVRGFSYTETCPTQQPSSGP